MFMRKKSTAVAMCAVISATSLCFGLVGCSHERPEQYYDPDTFAEFGNEFMLTMMGSDVMNWNALSVTPEQSYGYERYGEPSWYSYSPLSKSDAATVNFVFGMFKSEMKKYKFADLSEADKNTYRTMQNLLNNYSALYGSANATQLNLIDGSYISSQGGYVADFTTVMEGYAFRNEQDVTDLLKITVSTKDAFGTYLDFARDRENAGYPLYDYTITSMQSYLDNVSAQGENFYLYDYIDDKIDGANFLTATQKQDYKTQYNAALTDNFMVGVTTLSRGLNEYKGNVTITGQSYLASYGDLGKEYYKWAFGNKTGMINADMNSVLNELTSAADDCAQKLNDINTVVKTLEVANKAAYDDFNAYSNGEKALMDLDTPEKMLDYLKVAAKKIVPDLETVPQISINYMDDSVASITNTLAYYRLSPLDQNNSAESITINPVSAMDNPNDLLMTMAHEGYPGHLYAHVYSKEKGTDFLSTVLGSLTFAEGWAVYVEFALMDDIAEASDDVAVQLFCEYKKYEAMYGYCNMVVADLIVNYFGATVDDLVDMEIGEAEAREQIEFLMEIPAVYVPYGYGAYTFATVHDKAKAELGDAYSETEFNGVLLAEGKASVPRVKQITDEYIKSVKSKL